MLCLTEIIRPNDPAMQRLCRAVEDAWARTALDGVGPPQRRSAPPTVIVHNVSLSCNQR